MGTEASASAAADTYDWDVYCTCIDDKRRFHFFADGPEDPPHLYPVVRAIEAGWLRVNGRHGMVCPEALPAAARARWYQFCRVFGPNDGRRICGPALALEDEFARLIGTTPIDLEDNAFDLQFFLQAGFWLENLLTLRSR